MTFTLIEADCITAMASMDEASVDAICTDPPYGLEFMGKEWDRLQAASLDALIERHPDGQGKSVSPFYRPGWGNSAHQVSARESQAWHEAWATQALRVLKPGGHLIAAGGSRTYHRLTCAIEDAGFEIRDCLTWLYGSGFPKSLNVSEALRRLPACTCDVGSEPGTVDAGAPPRSIRAGAGTEARTVPLARETANIASRVGPDVGTDTANALPVVKDWIEDNIGNSEPVVLGPGGMTGTAERDEVATSVRGVQIEPESLGNDVVGHESVTGSAVQAGRVGDDLTRDRSPARSSVLPFTAAPSGVTGASEPSAIADSHASPGAIDGDPAAIANGGAMASGAGELHGLKCNTCGGVRRHLIPDGFGTALKPAVEFFVLARKPLIGTVAGNVTQFGTGALNIDGTRIEGIPPSVPQGTFVGSNNNRVQDGRNGTMSEPHVAGRWPPNVLLGHSPDCEEPCDECSGTHVHCAADCPVALLDEQSGERASGSRKVGEYRRLGGHGRYGEWAKGPMPAIDGDSGGASRFFYVAKADREERNRGLGHRAKGLPVDGADKWTEQDRRRGEGVTRQIAANVHPTVKPVELMQWLCRLITPPKGTILDPFTGSGSTGIAALREGFTFIGIEREPEYVEIARDRILGDAPLFNTELAHERNEG